MLPTNKARRSARLLRRNLSPPEVLLWARLKGAKPRIRRQHPIGAYVADFYCPATKFVIEVDGEHHDFGDQPDRDVARQLWIEKQGMTMIRIAAKEVLRNPDEVADAILRLCQTPPPRC